MLLPLLDFACLLYVAFAIMNCPRKGGEGEQADPDRAHPAVACVLGGIIPVGVAATMTWLFMIAGVATTVQFNVGSHQHMNAWSTWVDLWPVFGLLSIASVMATLAWVIVCLVKKDRRPLLAVASASLLLCILTFFTVLTRFPSA